MLASSYASKSPTNKLSETAYKSVTANDAFVFDAVQTMPNEANERPLTCGLSRGCYRSLRRKIMYPRDSAISLVSSPPDGFDMSFRHRRKLLPNLVALCLGIGISAAQNIPAVGADAAILQQTVQVDLTLPTVDGKTVQVHPDSDSKVQVICFVGCECPLAKLYAARLNELAKQFSQDDVRWIAINSNPQDSMAELKEYAEAHQLCFPVAKDNDSLAMTQLAATRTPEVIVIDELGMVIYRGRIDDQYRPGVIQPKPSRDDLRIAIEEQLAGKPVTIPRTEAAGCLIAKPRKIDPECNVTYCDQISQVLRRHCTECHREGEIGPFSLTSYEDATGWADMMLETIDQKRMPPWHATSNHAALMNQREMPAADRELIARWIEGGMPYGDADKLQQEPPRLTGWQLQREPDRVFDVTKQPFRVAAEGVIDYQYFVVDPGFDHDMWVDAAEIQPGNRGVVHHAIAFIRPPDGVSMEGLGLLTAYVPGQRVAQPSPGLAKRIPAGSKIVFQMHYTPNGSEQTDQSRLGMTFVDEKKVTHESLSIVGINHDLEIPPEQSAVQVDGHTSRFPRRGKLLSIAPHMHLRGKAITVQLERESGDEMILEVPHYDFNWQHTYLLAEPIPLNDVKQISFTATYDNSKQNPFNPDPTQFVTWGDQTWEEMAIVFYEVSKPLTDAEDGPTQQLASTENSTASNERERLRKDRELQEQHEQEREQEADRLLQDLDTNQDGIIEQDEVPLAVKWRLFNQLDGDGNRRVDRKEIVGYLEQHR